MTTQISGDPSNVMVVDQLSDFISTLNSQKSSFEAGTVSVVAKVANSRVLNFDSDLELEVNVMNIRAQPLPKGKLCF